MKSLNILIVFFVFGFFITPSILYSQQPGLGGVLSSEEKVLWLRAGDITLSNNDAIETWVDVSGNNNDAYQPAPDRQPSYISDGNGNFNGYPVVRFDGNGDFMSIDNNEQLNNMDGLTVIFVMRPNGTGTQSFLSKRIEHNIQNQYGFLYHQNRIRLDIEGSSVNSSQGLNTSYSYILTGRYDGSLTGNRQFIYRNASLSSAGSNTNTSIGTNSEPLRLGRFNDGDERTLDGDVAEILFYRTGLNNAERLVVENVLAVKYDIDIGDNLIYGNTTYTEDIIGVGTTDGIQKHSATTGNGGALYLEEYNNTFNETREFVFAGHDGTEHGITSENISTSGVEDRWRRIWYVERSVDGISNAGNTPITMTFDFDEAGLDPDMNHVYVLLYRNNLSDDFGFLPALFSSVAGNRVTFNVPNDLFNSGYYTIGRYTEDASDFMVKTWTSQSGGGDWNDQTTWLNQYNEQGTPNGSLTSQFDNIVIRNGHTVTITENDYQNNDIFVEEGGRLIIGKTHGHTWNTIRGQGRIEITGDYFPEGNAHQFIKPGGGTTVYDGAGKFEFETAREHNNLLIDLEDVNSSLTLLSDLTVNGNFYIDRGTFYMNDNNSQESLTIWVGENMRVAESMAQSDHARFFTGEGDARHTLTIRGDFTANAETRFCNLENPFYTSTPANGYSDVVFNHPTRDQVAQFNAETRFYRIEIDKGIDDTYKLLLRAHDKGLFYLLGRNNYTQTGTPPNRTNPNALGLLAGTVTIGNHVEIPRLRSGSSSNYDIDEDARIIVNGGRLIAPSNLTLAIVVYGNLTLENGYLEAFGNEGVTIREHGTFAVHGGIGKVHIVRTSVISGIHRGAYIQTGGTLTIDGSSGESNHYRFSFPYPTNSFTMTGGTMRVAQPKSGGSGNHGGILIAADKENIEVTGGTVNAVIDRDRDFIINSNAPFYNLNLIREVSQDRKFYFTHHPGGGPVPAQPARPLEVLNRLVVSEGDNPAKLDLQNITAYIHGDFIIQDGASIIGANAHIRFLGDRDSEVDIHSTTDIFAVDTLSMDKTLPEHAVLFHSEGRAQDETVFRIDHFLKVEKGLLNYRDFAVHLEGDLEIHDAIGEEGEEGRLLMQSTTSQSISVPVNNTSAYMGHLEVDNNQGVRLQNSSIPMMQNLTLTRGIFDIQGYGITLLGDLHGDDFGIDRMIATAGNHSDFGLRRQLTEDGDMVVFPMGTTADGNLRYTPLEARFSDVTDSLFVQLNPVAMELPTLATTPDPDEALTYYWRIRHSEPDYLPTVDAYVFSYDDSDLPAGAEDFVPGKVVDLERSHEPAANFDSPGQGSLTFDGENNDGFTLEMGEYTAGKPEKFVGEVKLFYSRGNSNYSSPNDWHDTDTWSLSGHDGEAASEIPGSGDLVQIGISGTSQNDYHALIITQNVDVAGMHILSHPDVWLSRVSVEDADITVKLGNVSGEGSVLQKMGAQTAGIYADFGAFNENPRSEFIYQASSNGDYSIPAHITVYPNLRFETPSDFDVDFLLPNQDLLIKGYFWINRGVQAVLSSDTYGDLTVLGNLRVGEESGGHQGRLLFPAADNSRTAIVKGDILIQGHQYSNIYAEDESSNATHHLVLDGNIEQQNGYFTLLRNNDPSLSRVVLELSGTTDAAYDRTGGNHPNFYRIVMNKGTNQNRSFTFNNDFNLNNDASGKAKPVELKNGLLHFAHDSIDVHLNTGDDHDFLIPSSGGLVMSAGTARVTGSAGIILDGLLRLQGNGELLMDENSAAITYGSSNNAVLEIHDNARLHVGSQIRRLSTYDSGILKYLQTGGTLIAGINSAPVGTRGVFEVLNEGSSFRFLAGELTLVRGNSGTEAELVMYPSDFQLGEDALIRLGNSTYTPQNHNIRIKSNVPLPNVIAEGSSGFRVEQVSEPLTIEGNFEISPGNTFDSNNLDFILKGDFINQGEFVPSNGVTYFAGNAQLLRGKTTFNDLVVQPATELLLCDEESSDIVVRGELSLLSGQLADQGNTIELRGDLFNQSEHISSQDTGGIRFAGSSVQNLNGNGVLGRMEIDNSYGVRLTNSLAINHELVFTKGMLDIGDYRLTLGPNSAITSSNDFGSTNMIESGGGINSAGVRFFMEGDGTFLLPVGTHKGYTPVVFAVTENPASNAFVDVIPISSMHVTITEDIDNLDYYWKLESQQMSNFSGDINFHYLQSDVEGDEEQYRAARLQVDNWSILGTAQVFEEENYFAFPHSESDDISGDYTAGSNIPDKVFSFQSKGDGNWNDPNIWENITSGEEAVPQGGPFGQIAIIREGHTVSTNGNQRIAYKLELDGTLEITEQAGHYLGEVDGSGRIYLKGDYLPVGNYTDFASAGKGTFEYSGTGNYTIDPTYLPKVGGINHVIFSGSGDRILPKFDPLHIYSDLEIRDETFLNNTIQQNTIILEGDLIKDSGASFRAGTDKSAQIRLQGSSVQTIHGDFTGENRLNILQLDNEQGLQFEGVTELEVELILQGGRVFTSQEGVLRLLDNAMVSGYNSNRYISGPLQKRGSGPFIFPVGKDDRIGRIEFTPEGAMHTGTLLQAEYFPQEHMYYENIQDPLHRVSSVEYWHLETIGEKSDDPEGRIRLFYEDSSFSGITDPAGLRVAIYQDDVWQDRGNSAYNQSSGKGDVRSDLISDGLTEFTFGTKDWNLHNNPLPIELLSFTAEPTAQGVLLEWVTASEVNNDFFTLERSKNGIHFEVIGYVQGVGHSSQKQFYQYTDSDPYTGVSYYRLKQTDLDGTHEYFKMVAVQFRKAQQASMLVYPNPVEQDVLNIRMAGATTDKKINLSLVDVHGRTLRSESIYADDAGHVAYQLNRLSALPAGVYFMVLQNREFRITERVIIR